MISGENLLAEMNALQEVRRSIDYLFLDFPIFPSKRIEVGLELTSQQPWMYFQFKGMDYLFRLHDLELKQDAPFWHMTAQRGTPAIFRGYQSLTAILTNNRYGHIAGEVSSPKGSKFKIRIENRNVQVEKLFLDEECRKRNIELLMAVMYTSASPKK